MMPPKKTDVEELLLWQHMLDNRLEHQQTGRLVWSPAATGWPPGWHREMWHLWRWRPPLEHPGLQCIAMLEYHGLVQTLQDGMLYELCLENEGRLGFAFGLESRQAVPMAPAWQDAASSSRGLTTKSSTSWSKQKCSCCGSICSQANVCTISWAGWSGHLL